MPLPGKLSIGILEEDNPQKSYFRLKPLLIQEGDRFAAFDGAEAYPEDGCIRIVPDKNESGHFKARMRRIGLYAVVDLRDHPGEHDKIRANKNYGGDGGERNAYIIYSDVVREPAPGELFALLSLRPEEADGALLPEPPDAPRALLYCDGALQEDVWTVEPVVEQESFRLVRAGERVDLAELQVFELKGFQDRPLSFAVLPPEKIERAPEPVRPARAAEPVRLTEPIRLPDGFHIEEEPEPAEPSAPPEEPPRAKAEARAKPAEPAPRAKPEKAPPAREGRPSPRERINASQVGLNPRKGRCLQEIIDDKWRFSRMEQLGAPTPSLVTGEPVRSPADAALDAVRAAWNRRDQREALVGALAKLDGLDGALNARRAALRASAVNEQLNELEAQRLKMLDEMEHLKRLGADVRAQLKQEILCEQADEFADVVARIDRARAECAHSEEEAARSREAAESVQDAINAMADGRFEERLREFAINSPRRHAAEARPAAPGAARGALRPARRRGADCAGDRDVRRSRRAAWPRGGREPARLRGAGIHPAGLGRARQRKDLCGAAAGPRARRRRRVLCHLRACGCAARWPSRRSRAGGRARALPVGRARRSVQTGWRGAIRGRCRRRSGESAGQGGCGVGWRRRLRAGRGAR